MDVNTLEYSATGHFEREVRVRDFESVVSSLDFDCCVVSICGLNEDLMITNECIQSYF